MTSEVMPRCFFTMYDEVTTVSPEGSQAVRDDSRIQVVDHTDSKEAEHGHAERWQPNTHRSHCVRKILGMFLRVNESSGTKTRTVLTANRRGEMWAGDSDVAQTTAKTSQYTNILLSPHLAFMCRIITPTVNVQIAEGWKKPKQPTGYFQQLARR